MKVNEIPKTYEEWKYCIGIKCRQELSKDFILERIKTYSTPHNPETIRFINHYGSVHLVNILNWYKKALEE
jgi:hypothetical protein